MSTPACLLHEDQKIIIQNRKQKISLSIKPIPVVTDLVRVGMDGWEWIKDRFNQSSESTSLTITCK